MAVSPTVAGRALQGQPSTCIPAQGSCLSSCLRLCGVDAGSAGPESGAGAATDGSGHAAQVKVNAQAVKQLRQMSGAGMMDAKKALLQTGGDVDKALEHLRKKGLASADKKAGRLASEGAIGAYIHAGSRFAASTLSNPPSYARETDRAAHARCASGGIKPPTYVHA